MFSLRNLRIGLASIALMLLFLTSSGLDAQYRLRSGVVSAAGDTSSSAGVRMLASGGQPHPVAPSSSFTRVLIPGFIPGLIPPVQQNTATISGTIRDTQQVAIGGVTVNFSNADTSISTTTNSSGFYSLAVPSGASGIVAPSRDNYSFSPLEIPYTNITSDIANQDYIGTFTSGQPAIPINLQARDVFSDSVLLTWETPSLMIVDQFEIEITNPPDTLNFMPYDKVPGDTLQLPLLRLQPEKTYYTRVRAVVAGSTQVRISNNFQRQAGQASAFAQDPGKSDWAVTRFVTLSGGARPTDLVASTRSNTAILLTWKDNSNDPDEEFQIERKGPVGDWADILTEPLPANTRSYLDDNGLAPATTYKYLVRLAARSVTSNEATARTDAITSIAQHSNGLEVDNQGGGAGGWSHFNVLGFDQIYDGHLQIWTGGTAVYDGDDGDFNSETGILMHAPSAGIADEHTASETNPLQPVIIQITDEGIEIQQVTYQVEGQSWILVAWVVKNNGATDKNVKLAFFLDADAGGELSVQDVGGFDTAHNLVYLSNSEKSVGMALISDLISETTYFDNYQISPFTDSRSPDNSPTYPASNDAARRALFLGSDSGTLFPGAADLTMTLVSDLGSIGSEESKKIIYAIVVGNNPGDLQATIDDGIVALAPCLSPCFWADVDCSDFVDISDVQKVAAHWSPTGDDDNYDPHFDVDDVGSVCRGNGKIDISDIQAVASWMNRPIPAGGVINKADVTHQESDKKSHGVLK